MGMAGAHVLALPWRGLLPGICLAAKRAEAAALPRHSVVPCRHAAGATLTALITSARTLQSQGFGCTAALSTIIGYNAISYMLPKEVPRGGEREY